jgi:cAMP phosphodiesterase
MAASDEMRSRVRDVVLTHAHLDHIAGLPLFVDDLYASLDEPIRIYALQEVIDVLERDIFNWSVFPRFSELSIGAGPAIEYRPITSGQVFNIGDLTFHAFASDHKVPSTGYLISDGASTIAVSGDTATLDGLGDSLSAVKDLKAILVECAFPDELTKIARTSHHMTPATLAEHLQKLGPDCPIYVCNIKPSYRDKVVTQLAELKIKGLEIMSVGKTYSW